MVNPLLVIDVCATLLDAYPNAVSLNELTEILQQTWHTATEDAVLSILKRYLKGKAVLTPDGYWRYAKDSDSAITPLAAVTAANTIYLVESNPSIEIGCLDLKFLDRVYLFTGTNCIGINIDNRNVSIFPIPQKLTAHIDSHDWMFWSLRCMLHTTFCTHSKMERNFVILSDDLRAQKLVYLLRAEGQKARWETFSSFQLIVQRTFEEQKLSNGHMVELS